MNLDLDHPEAEMSSTARAWYAARTALLLLGAVAASVFMVELPAPAAGGQAKAETHVPASDRWLALGESATPDARGPKPVSGLNPTATMDGREPRSRRRQRGIRLAGLGGEAGRLDRPGADLTGGGIRWNASLKRSPSESSLTSRAKSKLRPAWVPAFWSRLLASLASGAGMTKAVPVDWAGPSQGGGGRG